MKILGIVGNISSGKTTLSKYLKKLGIPVIEADRINHKHVLRDEGVKKQIATLTQMPFYSITRKILREILLNNETKRKALEALLWPKIKYQVISCINFFKKKKYKTIAIEATLMEELDLIQYIDFLILIKASPNLRLKRTITLRNYTEFDAELILKMQENDNKYLTYNPIVIKNEKTIREFYKEVEKKVIPIIIPNSKN